MSRANPRMSKLTASSIKHTFSAAYWATSTPPSGAGRNASAAEAAAIRMSLDVGIGSNFNNWFSLLLRPDCGYHGLRLRLPQSLLRRLLEGYKKRELKEEIKVLRMEKVQLLLFKVGIGERNLMVDLDGATGPVLVPEERVYNATIAKEFGHVKRDCTLRKDKGKKCDDASSCNSLVVADDGDCLTVSEVIVSSLVECGRALGILTKSSIAAGSWSSIAAESWSLIAASHGLRLQLVMVLDCGCLKVSFDVSWKAIRRGS
ncbi:hypothetical protein Acr_14g0008910 [Actinidia rufa]|uniref:Uncharacterized protein n=1 Tax=Actinidia rufa TaxID=165716 RepID=A0A7J0FRC2_9ERIC|nr:hypothetical protein Acr_14g0008910 [Actinidia rufa]